MKKIGAFFDIDGTLYRDSLMIEHFNKMINCEIIDPALWHTHIKKPYEDWQNRRGDYEDYMEKLVLVYVEALKGLKKDDLSFLSKQVVNLTGGAVYSYARERIKYHQNRNEPVFFISGSPDYLVELMADKYHVTDFQGTTYKIDKNGCFTGDLVPNWDAKSKNKIIEKFIKEYDIDASSSYAYGDTNGDTSMLRMVGNAVAINPTYELLDIIKKDITLSSKTTIIVERKDVIYELTPDVSAHSLL